jgi:hypothetical protein
MHGSIMKVYLFVKFEDILQDKPVACDHFWNEITFYSKVGKLLTLVDACNVHETSKLIITVRIWNFIGDCHVIQYKSVVIMGKKS